MTNTMLLYRAESGATGTSVTVNPSKILTKSVRMHLKLSGGTGGASNVTVRIDGRATTNSDAPWYTIAQVVGNWQSATGSEVNANSDGSYAFETVAFPAMRAKVMSYGAGTAVAASATNGVIVLTNPSDGDWVQIDDGYGNSPKFMFYTTTPSIAEGVVPVAIGVDSSATAVLFRAALNAEAALYKLHITAAEGSGITRSDLTHKIVGTTGNSTSITSSPAHGAGTFYIVALSGGTGEDTYASVWIDSGY